MSKVEPSSFLHTSGDNPPHPESVAISNHTSVMLPSHADTWSWATIVYIVVALVALSVYMYGTRKSQRQHSREGGTFDAFVARTVFLMVWIGVGLALVMAASHNNNKTMAWSIVVISLAPALSVAYWMVREANRKDD